MLHLLPLPLSSCLGCIPPLIGLPSLRFYAVGSSLFLLSVCFCLCFLFLSRRCPLLATSCPSFSVCFPCSSPIPGLILFWFRLSCDHGWIRSGSVNVRKQQQQLLGWGYAKPVEKLEIESVYARKSFKNADKNQYMYVQHYLWFNRLRLTILFLVSRAGKHVFPFSLFAPENSISRDGFGHQSPCAFSTLGLSLEFAIGMVHYYYYYYCCTYTCSPTEEA